MWTLAAESLVGPPLSEIGAPLRTKSIEILKILYVLVVERAKDFHLLD
jgi:hypothetical protein